MIGATLDQVFQNMTEPTRDNFMEELRSIKDFQAPLMLPGTAVNTTQDGQPAVSTRGRAEVQRPGLRHGGELRLITG